MEFKEGTHVFTSDGEDIGSIDRVVLDPRSNEVRGIVVRQGWLFTEDKVVPIELVDTAVEDRVTLRRSEANLQDLPEFEETYYVPLNEEDFASPDGLTGTPVSYASPLYTYPPVGTAWWGYGAYLGYPPVDAGLAPDYAERVKQNIPEGTVAVKEGARVLSRQGEHVGDVERIYADPDTNQVTHIVVSQGLLFKSRKLVPTNWIQQANEEEVMLTVNTSVVDHLPDYQE